MVNVRGGVEDLASPEDGTVEIDATTASAGCGMLPYTEYRDLQFAKKDVNRLISVGRDVIVFVDVSLTA